MTFTQTKTQKNIYLGYALTFINNSFFWYAPWLLYLLNYIDFSQAAILQSIGMLTSVLAEIPTGALADLIGKKKTLNLAFLLTGIGEMVMGFSRTYPMFIMSYIILNIGYSFYSGTMEAFTYDTLASNKEEGNFGKVIAKSSAFSSAGTSLSSIIGGYMYSLWLGLPFFATGFAKLLGLILSLFIDEPEVDTDKFSLPNFLAQTKKGFKHLFDKKLLGFTLLLLTFSIFHVATYEIIDDLAVIDYGYTAKAIGFLYAAAIFIEIPSSLLYEKISRKVPPIKLIYIGIFALALHYMFSPFIGVAVWSGLFLLRVAYSPVRNNAISEILNKNTESRIRATTLSTLNMVKIVPFVLMAGFIGKATESYGVRNFNAAFFTLLLIVAIPQIYLLVKKRFELNGSNPIGNNML